MAWSEDQQKQSEAIKQRVRAVHSESCSDLLRCPQCANVLQKPAGMYDTEKVDRLEHELSVSNLLDPYFHNEFHCYFCGAKLEKLEVFEGKHDVQRASLSSREQRMLAAQEDFCVRCENHRSLERSRSGLCSGNKYHTYGRSPGGHGSSNGFNFRRIGYRLMPRWIPEDWPSHFMGLSFWLRVPPEWYVGMPHGGSSFSAAHRETGLHLKIVNFTVNDGFSSTDEFVDSVVTDLGQHREMTIKARQRLHMPRVKDTLWPRYISERPLFSHLEPCREAAWLRVQYRIDTIKVHESYVFQQGEHILAAQYTYPHVCHSVLDPLIRRSAATIRMATSISRA